MRGTIYALSIGAAALALHAAPARAECYEPLPASPGAYDCVTVQSYLNTSSQAQPVTAATPLPVTAVIGGGSTVAATQSGAWQQTPLGAATTSASGVIASANAYQTALAASAARKGCLIANNSSLTQLVYVGASGSAASGASIPVVANGTFSCVVASIVLTDAISITSSASGGSFAVLSQ